MSVYLHVAQSTNWGHFPNQTGIWKCVFEKGKPKFSEKNLLRQGGEPTTNSTHIWRWVQKSNLGHIGGRQVLSPLRHPCSTKAPPLSLVAWRNQEKLVTFLLLLFPPLVSDANPSQVNQHEVIAKYHNSPSALYSMVPQDTQHEVTKSITGSPAWWN